MKSPEANKNDRENDNEIIRKLEGEEGTLSSAAKSRLETVKNACAKLLKLATNERIDEAHPIPRDETAVEFFRYLNRRLNRLNPQQ